MYISLLIVGLLIVRYNAKSLSSLRLISLFFCSVSLNYKLIFRDILYAHRDLDTGDRDTRPNFLEPCMLLAK